MLTLLLPAAGHELFKVAKELLPGRCLQLVHAERTLASGASAGFVPVVTEPAQTGKEIEALFCAWTSSFSRSSSDPHWSA